MSGKPQRTVSSAVSASMVPRATLVPSAEISAKNPKFKKVYENWKPFRNEEILWFRVSENTFDNFMARQSAANKL